MWLRLCFWRSDIVAADPVGVGLQLDAIRVEEVASVCSTLYSVSVTILVDDLGETVQAWAVKGSCSAASFFIE